VRHRGQHRGHFKVGAKGRPELWFFFGRVAGTAEVAPRLIRQLFEETEKPNYSPPLALGGKTSFYEWRKDEHWQVVCIGFELGQIQSAEQLADAAVKPLLAEAQQRALIQF
jgi:hypothetical protein